MGQSQTRDISNLDLRMYRRGKDDIATWETESYRNFFGEAEQND